MLFLSFVLVFGAVSSGQLLELEKESHEARLLRFAHVKQLITDHFVYTACCALFCTSHDRNQEKIMQPQMKQPVPSSHGPAKVANVSCCHLSGTSASTQEPAKGDVKGNTPLGCAVP